MFYENPCGFLRKTQKVGETKVLYETLQKRAILLCFTNVFCFFGSREPVWGPAAARIIAVP